MTNNKTSCCWPISRGERVNIIILGSDEVADDEPFEVLHCPYTSLQRSNKVLCNLSATVPMHQASTSPTEWEKIKLKISFFVLSFSSLSRICARHDDDDCWISICKLEKSFHIAAYWPPFFLPARARTQHRPLRSCCPRFSSPPPPVDRARTHQIVFRVRRYHPIGFSIE